MDPFYEAFGIRLRQMRRQAGLTQEQLAGRLGRDRTTIVNIERGRQRVALHQLVELADVLGCEAADLLPEPRPQGGGGRTDGIGDDRAAAFVAHVQSKKTARR